MVRIPKRFDTPATVEYLGLRPDVSATVHDIWASEDGHAKEPVVHLVLKYLDTAK
jgi:hypothetical protein